MHILKFLVHCREYLYSCAVLEVVMDIVVLDDGMASACAKPAAIHPDIAKTKVIFVRVSCHISTHPLLFTVLEHQIVRRSARCPICECLCMCFAYAGASHNGACIRKADIINGCVAG